MDLLTAVNTIFLTSTNPKAKKETITKPVVANPTAKISRPSLIPWHLFKKKKKSQSQKYRDHAHFQKYHLLTLTVKIKRLKLELDMSY